MDFKFKEQIRSDYRHYICLGITLLFLGSGFLFPNALPRIGEAARDLGTSIVYYFYSLFLDNPEACPVPPTVLTKQSWQWAEAIWEPFYIFPWTWAEFKVLWGKYWKLVFTWKNFGDYVFSLSSVLEVVLKVTILALPMVVPLWLKLQSYTDEQDEDQTDEDSKALLLFKKFLFTKIYPVVAWCKGFFRFVQENKLYYQTWLFLWSLYFNATLV